MPPEEISSWRTYRPIVRPRAGGFDSTMESYTLPRLLRLSGARKPVVVESMEQCATRDAEELGGLGLVSSAALERFEDALTLERRDLAFQRSGALCCGALGRWK